MVSGPCDSVSSRSRVTLLLKQFLFFQLTSQGGFLGSWCGANKYRSQSFGFFPHVRTSFASPVTSEHVSLSGVMQACIPKATRNTWKDEQRFLTRSAILYTWLHNWCQWDIELCNVSADLAKLRVKSHQSCLHHDARIISTLWRRRHVNCRPSFPIARIMQNTCSQIG
jgi:hypothetical protein